MICNKHCDDVKVSQLSFLRDRSDDFQNLMVLSKDTSLVKFLMKIKSVVLT